jgi:hypothetical protein
MKLIQEQFIINAKGKKTGVILSVTQYQQLLEDLHDLAIVAERRQEPTLTLAELKKRLKKPAHVQHYSKNLRGKRFTQVTHPNS